MSNVNRTAQCKKCGEVLFKLVPHVGYVTYNCRKCNSEVAKVKCDNYETLRRTCRECGGDIFKVKVTVDKSDSSQGYWEPECVKCKNSPQAIYVDNEGNEIDKGTRQYLMMKDKIENLEEEVSISKESIKYLK